MYHCDNTSSISFELTNWIEVEWGKFCYLSEVNFKLSYEQRNRHTFYSYVFSFYWVIQTFYLGFFFIILNLKWKKEYCLVSCNWYSCIPISYKIRYSQIIFQLRFWSWSERMFEFEICIWDENIDLTSNKMIYKFIKL